MFPWKTAFHSGMSSRSDLRAAIDQGVAIGVVATLLDVSKRTLALPRFLDKGGAVFVDSGAFAAFQKGEEVDWHRVFTAYESILVMTDKPEGLSIVAPDVIGCQQRTLALWEQYAARVSSWIAAGARVIVPLQRGQLCAGQMLAHAKRVFGDVPFAVGIPSNLEAMTSEDALTIRGHDDFHILGRVVLNDELRTKIDALRSGNPNAVFTADANWLRSRLRQISAAMRPVVADPLGRPTDSARTLAVRSVLQNDSYCARAISAA